MARVILSAACAASLVLFSGCSYMPTSGPNRSDVQNAAATIQVVDVDDAVARRLLAQRSLLLFSETLGQRRSVERFVGPGDTIEVALWEASPATLFGAGPSTDARGALQTSRAMTLPEQMIDAEGFIRVPFAGRIQAAGRTVAQIETDIASRLVGKANQPEAIVRITRSVSSSVTVVGEVNTSTRVPLTPGNERLLDAIAAAAGVRQPVNKMTIQLARGGGVHALPMQTIIQDPRQNVILQPGDVVTALFQPLSFNVLGATGKNEEIAFEAQGISLAQALARAGGLQDARSDAQGVFIFRFEPEGALAWPRQPVARTPDGLVPVIYRIDLKDPTSFFVMQSFAMNNKDLLYVSNAPAAELQKFLNIVFSVAYPVLTAVQVSQ